MVRGYGYGLRHMVRGYGYGLRHMVRVRGKGEEGTKEAYNMHVPE
jgi:hypothetical protein